MTKCRSFIVSLVTVLAACGGDGPSGPVGGGQFGTFSAVIDGVPWAANGLYMTAAAQPGGIFTFGGQNVATGGIILSMTLYHIGAPGTYPLGVTSTVPGGSASITLLPNILWSDLTGSSGTVNVTAVSPSNIAGTFSFTASPMPGSSGPNKSVTQGQFNINFPSPGSLTIAPNAGSTFGGLLAGQSWNAATIVNVVHPSSGTLNIGASNDRYSVTINIGGFTGVGIHTLGSVVGKTMMVIDLGTSQSYGGSQSTSAGTVQITAYNSNRVQGTYNATLQRLSPAGSITLSGSFNVGLQGG